ncbi:hypothetical protein [Nocardia blacklockiae]|uniref:hypothetical protein n=1 Tax=Nocardia blacklockiae TaxID=480036 RepID=UPI001893BD18|nr:hypothetical protein [Nocardia blacklockiae]MBF6175795.1 hypothetical protein [Nocardia blacklockiae]
MAVPAAEPLSDIRLGVVHGTTYGLFGPPGEFVPQARALGSRIVRINVYWAQVEPEPGKLVWDAVDALLDQLGDADEAWVTVVSSSRWATRRATGWLPASAALDPAAYRRFVGALAGRRPGAIRFWQCEIEPCLPLFWAGTATEYLAQLRDFHDTVKSADPAASVVLGGAVPGAMLGDDAAGARTWGNFFGQVLREAGAYFDIFDVHPYGDPYAIPGLVQACHTQMTAHGYDKPVVASEHSGPLPTQFPANRPYLADALTTHQQQFLGEIPMPDTAEGMAAAEDPAAVALYERMDQLPPTLQMFMAGCAPELEAERHRLASRDLVIRTILALSAGVRRNLHYPIASESQLHRDSRIAPALLFGKLELMARDGDIITHRYPAADTFELMARRLDGMEGVERVVLPGRPGTYLFEVRRGGRGPLLVAWEREQVGAGADGWSEAESGIRAGTPSAAAPPLASIQSAPISYPWPHPTSSAVDIHGTPTPINLSRNQVHFPVSPTPIFIDSDQ